MSAFLQTPTPRSARCTSPEHHDWKCLGITGFNEDYETALFLYWCQGCGTIGEGSARNGIAILHRVKEKP